MAFKALVSLLISCLGDLSIADSGVLRSPTISVFLSICLFIVVKSWLEGEPPCQGAGKR